MTLCYNRDHTCFSDTLKCARPLGGCYKTLTFQALVTTSLGGPADVNACKFLFDPCHKIYKSVRFRGLYEYILEMTIPNVV